MARPVRSVQVAGNLLREFRTKLNWTQEDLAKASGYSSRLIRKLESNGAAEIETLENIAEALSIRGNQVTPEMLTLNIVATARAWMDALNAHGPRMVAAIAHFLSEDFEFHCPGDPNVTPFAGTWKGASGLHEFFGIYFSIFDRLPHADVTYSVGENIVVARFHEYARVNGVMLGPVRVNMCFSFRNGLITRIDDDYDSVAGNQTSEMMSSDEAQATKIVNAFVKRFELRDSSLAEFLATCVVPDFVLACHAPGDLPFAGEWKGPEGAAQFLSNFYAIFSRVPNQLTFEILRSNKQFVVRFVEQLVYQGVELPPAWVQLYFKFSDGKLTRIEHEFDRYVEQLSKIGIVLKQDK